MSSSSFSPTIPIGYGVVVPGSTSGLVSSSGLPANTSGTAVATNYVGEVVQFYGTKTSAVSGTYHSFSGTTISPGTYLVSLYAQCNGSGVTGIIGCISKTSTDSANLDAEGVGAEIDFKYSGSYTTASGVNNLRASGTWVLRVTSSATYYLRALYNGTSGNVLAWATLIRIA